MNDNDLSSLTIAVVGAGDMGGPVAAALKRAGADVVAAGEGRGAETRERIAASGLRDLGSVAACAREADLFLSIMPPDKAAETAEAAAAAIDGSGHGLLYADCNAVAPQTVQDIAATMVRAGGHFIDAGIIGANPDHETTRFYVSGPEARALEVIALEGRIAVEVVGPEIGQASGLKMCYAALTKGSNTLMVAVLLTARELGFYDALIEEFAASQASRLRAMREGLPRLACDSARWVREMEEIALTFEGAGTTGKFHEGAAFIHRVLAASPLAAETRATADRNRTLETSLAAWATALPKHREPG